MSSVSCYTVNTPALIHFGCGTRRLAVQAIAGLVPAAAAKVFLVASGGALRSAAGGELLELLKSRFDLQTATGIPHDPPLACVSALIEAMRGSGRNVVVALGGGSVMDAAKAAALLHQGDGSVADYFNGLLPLPSTSLPLIALPATAGTGAEITPNAVLTDPDGQSKRSLRSSLMVPRVALCDPDFTLGLPERITIDSGLDALTQALESYVSLQASEYSRGLAERSVMLLLAALPQAVAEPYAVAARSQVAEGSLLGALAFAQSSLGAVHGLAHPIGHCLNLAHGYACAVLLPHILAWNLPVCRPELQRLAQSAGLASAEALVEKVAGLVRALRIPATFAGDGLAPEHFPHILKHCRSGSMKTNPRPLSDEEVLALLGHLAAPA